MTRVATQRKRSGKKNFKYFTKGPAHSHQRWMFWVCVTNGRTFNSAKAPGKEFQIKLLYKGKNSQNWRHSKLKTHFELHKVKRIENFVKSERTKQKRIEWMNEKKRNLVFVWMQSKRSMFNAWFGWTVIQVLHLQMWCFVASWNWQCNRK